MSSRNILMLPRMMGGEIGGVRGVMQFVFALSDLYFPFGRMAWRVDRCAIGRPIGKIPFTPKILVTKC
jgi:hypothetical protein